MINMNTEQAYSVIAGILSAHFEPNEVFDRLELMVEIGDGATRRQVWKHFNGVSSQPIGKRLPLQAGADLRRAVFFLRDNLLETTNEQIWGLVFTLYPDSSFNIDYTYEKSDWLKCGE
ncbi:hypothetical protein [Pseudoalteromonas luteoviolacea]|uniref:hypothetical protein n=1 Tax=Pseudoalteromonas luteoviolacea TaxID=43657 RepID=UPI00114FE7CD|nr:hypothetical protein [Pseudoalteromonas luteoviolacea]TQF67874.1 hypothetical protein FLM44_22095 [Pseudoalteromonas luteoviolacea]